MPAVHEPIHAPEFSPGDWINSPPLTIAGLRGKVVLVDFWDYTCVNCLRTLPYVLEWWRRYRAAGLVVIGVHSPEFPFARDIEHVRNAVQRLGIEYPVLLDNAWQTWSVWANRYWPAKYLVNAHGYIKHFQYGEGHYQEVELAIQRSLHEIDPRRQFPSPMAPIRATDIPGAVCHRATPELYLGYRRGRIGNPEGYVPDMAVNYAVADVIQPDIAYLSGEWYNGAYGIVLVAEQGTVSVRYQAKEVNIVAEPPATDSGILEIEQDGKPLELDTLGRDVHRWENVSTVQVDTPRMYNLVQNAAYGTHTLRISAIPPGITLYDFSFITECVPRESEEETAA